MALMQQQAYAIRADELFAQERDEEDLASVGFAELAGDAKPYVSLTRSFADDSFYLERDDQKVELLRRY